MKLKPLNWENDRLIIHPFRAEDVSRFKDIARDVHSILSDNQTLRYLQAKKLNTLAEAESYLKGVILNAHNGRSSVHFITLKKLDMIVGMIDLISPETAREHYQINQYPYFLEFYLKGFAQKKKIMVEALLPLLYNLQQQQIGPIAAVAHRSNTPAISVLERTGFKYHSMFDAVQDLYQI